METGQPKYWKEIVPTEKPHKFPNINFLGEDIEPVNILLFSKLINWPEASE